MRVTEAASVMAGGQGVHVCCRNRGERGERERSEPTGGPVIPAISVRDCSPRRGDRDPDPAPLALSDAGTESGADL